MHGDASTGPEIGLVLYPGCQMAMVHGITDMFEVASFYARAQARAPLRTSHWHMGDDGTFTRAHDSAPGMSGDPDVLIVPGRLGPLADADEAAPYARWLLDRHARGTVLASTCGGAFILAATGLLAGREATTHWFFAQEMQGRFPDIRVEPGRIVIDDGDLITAGGLMAWTDLGLRLVDRLLGPSIMLETAKFMLINPGGREQRNYSVFSPQLTHGDEAILKVQHWLQSRAGRLVSVPDMMRQAGLEERTFLRRFKSATGMKPIEYVQHLRVGKARELLEFTRRPVDQIAWSVGYEDPAAFRRVFARVVGLSPGDYRTRFASRTELDAVA
ncbi:GlxA family transcriptional regulator [Rhizorhabdus phycosphaerae]|uniref:GlxA family transcriptional regulator n=1 Tax=Rhizorhabdus phycosphaerae TaxID=2711156 RepID=UPI0013EB993A|nr:GlxA family transcriptional regulator [Rhizorhabdus phycosphaerae]